MPLTHRNGSWYWGSKGPFPTKAKALSVARAAYAHGYKEDANITNKQQMLNARVHKSKEQT